MNGLPGRVCLFFGMFDARETRRGGAREEVRKATTAKTFSSVAICRDPRHDRARFRPSVNFCPERPPPPLFDEIDPRLGRARPET
jgi:hypothetical protein